MQFGNLKYKIEIKKKIIDDQIDVLMSKKFENQKIDINGVEVILSKSGMCNSNITDTYIDLSIPFKIDVKRPAGLFSVEGKGELRVTIRITYNLCDDWKIDFKSDILDYKWISKPQIEIGSLSITLEKLTTLVLQHYESIFTAKIDKTISRYSNLKPLLKKLIQNIENEIKHLLPFDLFPQILSDGIWMQPILFNKKSIILSGNMRMACRIEESQRKVELPTLNKKYINSLSDNIPIFINLTYASLSEMLKHKLVEMEIGGKKMVINDVNISSDNKLYVVIDIIQPFKGSIVIKGTPIFDPLDSMLDIVNLKTDLRSSNILYKMTSPMVEKIIKNKLQEQLPIDLEEMTAVILQKLKQTQTIQNFSIATMIDKLKIQDIQFNNNNIYANTSLENTNIEAQIS